MTALPATPSAGGQLEPATQVFIASLASAKPIYTLSPEAARAALADAQKSVPVTLAPASVEDRVLIRRRTTCARSSQSTEPAHQHGPSRGDECREGQGGQVLIGQESGAALDRPA